jgi:hypothetical protein
VPVKRCYKLIAIFLPAFLLAISVMAGTPHIDTVRTRLKARQCLIFCRQKGYNSRYCILIDMSLPSGVKRFMVWDFRKNNILISGLVSHGCGNGPKISRHLVTSTEATAQRLENMPCKAV